MRRNATVAGSDELADMLAELLRRTSNLERVAGTSSPVAQTGAFNGLINATMQVAQRGTSFALAAATPAYTVDRWQALRSATGATVSRVAGSNQFDRMLRIQRDSGNTSTAPIYVCQSIESLDCYRFRGQRCSLSFYAIAGALFSADNEAVGVRISAGTGTDENHLVSVTGQTLPLNVNVPVSTVLTRQTVSFDVPANATTIGVLFIHAPTGTAGATDYVDITGVQLEVGPASPFGYTDQALERIRTRRFFRRMGGDATLSPFGHGHIRTTTQSKIMVELGSPMRVLPTVTRTGTTQILGGDNVQYAVTAATLQGTQSSVERLVLNVDHATATAVQPGVWRANNTTSDWVDLSAEL